MIILCYLFCPFFTFKADSFYLKLANVLLALSLPIARQESMTLPDSSIALGSFLKNLVALISADLSTEVTGRFTSIDFAIYKDISIEGNQLVVAFLIPVAAGVFLSFAHNLLLFRIFWLICSFFYRFNEISPRRNAILVK
jgi:hypothetical protein